MSTPNGEKAFVDQSVREAQALIAHAEAEQQSNLFDDPVTPDDMQAAREELGPNAGRVSVLAHARARKQGRPRGARNRRNIEFEQYIRQFGPDPAVTLMIIQGTDPDVLIEQSRRSITKMTKGGNLVVVDEAMSYSEALSLKVRCAEAILPYLHGKKPTAVDLTVQHDGMLVIGGVTHSAGEVQDIIDAQFLPIDDLDEDAA